MVSGARIVSGTGPSRDPVCGSSEPTPAPFDQKLFDRLPERPGGRGPTSGILSRTDGRGPIHLVSGQKGPGRGSPGLTGRIAKLQVAGDHVEGHAAALMRRAGAPREATLYLNNKPCPGQYGCDETLPSQLPEGSKLTVYWPGGHKVYRGTGEGLE
ncbi:DddA-like double-stranded DNA deaminase toxin [Kribbella swartbergensis]